MIFLLAVAASVATQQAPAPAPDPSLLKDAAQAIKADRLQEAKLIIARAVSMGFRGAPIERLTADLNFASGKYLQAWAGYQRLVASPDKQPSDCEKGAISALQIEKFEDAKPLVDCAVASPKVSWRAWNARGVLADTEHDWDTADAAYERARKLAPNEARVINNQGWSMLLRGDWAAAVPLFQKAVTMDENSERIANNLELAKTALAADLPQRRPRESNEDWAARLNDAGVAAELLGDKRRAVAAFTQALNASPVWYDRASNNLKALGQN
jgi:Flp pilus assembly protein TadD